MIEDPRTPTSITRVTHRGRVYTVKVFCSEEEYRALIARYYTEDEQHTTPRKPRTGASPSPVFQKRKPQARYNWASKLGA